MAAARAWLGSLFSPAGVALDERQREPAEALRCPSCGKAQDGATSADPDRCAKCGAFLATEVSRPMEDQVREHLYGTRPPGHRDWHST